MIDPVDRIPRETIRIVGQRMSVAVTGNGPTVVFLHGNATYSYTWRNVIPYLGLTHRILAPDLLGTGESDVVYPSGPSSYSFSDQAYQIDLLLGAMDEGPLVLIGHELGGAIAIQYARNHPDRVAGLCLVEGVFRVTNDSTFDTGTVELLASLRSEEGEKRALIDNAIVDEYLPRLTARQLGPAEMEAYRTPYRKPGESRRAMLSMIRQLPLRSSPGPIDDQAEQNRRWCARSRIPKLVIGGMPGFLVPPGVLGTAAKWAGTRVAAVPGIHFLTEDSPARLTTLILDWLTEIGHV